MKYMQIIQRAYTNQVTMLTGLIEIYKTGLCILSYAIIN
jgi:hypothetical protein